MRLELLFISVFMTVFFSIGSAQTFTANSLLAINDANIGDGICDDGNGNCTFRAAVEEGNANVVSNINCSVNGAINTVNFNYIQFSNTIKNGGGVLENIGIVSTGTNILVDNMEFSYMKNSGMSAWSVTVSENKDPVKFIK